jgi:cell division septal protein FtsQ
METNERTRQPGGKRPAQRPQGQQAKRPAQPQTAAQRRAVKMQQEQRQAAAREQSARQTAKRPAPPKKRKKNAGILGALKSPAKKNSPKTNREQAARAAKLKAMRQEVSQKEQVRRRRKVSRPRKPGVPVVYTAPTPFNVQRLITQLVSVFAVVIAAVLCMSIFFKVEVIEVSGAKAYDEWTVREASGIQEGDRLLTFSRGKAGGRIKTQLQYVDQVRFGIKLPNTVIIDIKEFNVVYAVKASDGTWYLINSNGKIMEQTDGGTAAGYTKILGIHLTGPIVGEQARAAEEIVAAPESTKPAEDSTEVTVPQVLITNQSRLDAALRILRELEINGIVGDAASVDVSDMSRIELWYGTRYQVNLGDENDMEKKIADMKATISQLAEYENGMLDISYDIWEDKVGYTPFS